MPELALLSTTRENEIARLEGGPFGNAAHVVGGALPHDLISAMMARITNTIASLSSVQSVRALAFHPELVGPLAVVSSFDLALARLGEIASAGPNWDGYGAPAIEATTVVASLLFLHNVATQAGLQPAIVATGAGNIQFEWHWGTSAIDVEIGPDFSFNATQWMSHAEIGEWNGDVRTGIDPDLARAIGWVGRGLVS